MFQQGRLLKLNADTNSGSADLRHLTRAPLDRIQSVNQLSENLNQGAAPSRRGGVKSRRSRSFSGLLGGYPRTSQGPRRRLGEAADEEGESMEEEEFKETEVEGSPEAS
ncbi:hypothetical protein O181_013220 [Austropuccinia psidii MF-1]|uniref:Uncharacterized protein n=1 Tax=Austropuccinia psidii MF-1 TaxID=1389203 RepID=A0A9Q3BZF5_9BASI|nr:hypothetical protein [Austropuccinia psidii MF-1]